MRPFIDFVRERTYLKNVSPRTIEFYWNCEKSVLSFGDLQSRIVSCSQANDVALEVRIPQFGISTTARLIDSSHGSVERTVEIISH